MNAVFCEKVGRLSYLYHGSSQNDHYVSNFSVDELTARMSRFSRGSPLGKTLSTDYSVYRQKS